MEALLHTLRLISPLHPRFEGDLLGTSILKAQIEVMQQRFNAESLVSVMVDLSSLLACSISLKLVNGGLCKAKL